MKTHSETGETVAADKPLPEGFSARTDFDAGTIAISKDGVSVTISKGSFAAVANALNDLWPEGAPSLEPGAALTVTDGFTGRSASLPASALSDAAAVLSAFVVKPVPVAEQEPAAQPEEAAEAVEASGEGKAPVVTRKRARQPAPAPVRQAAAPEKRTKAAVDKAQPAQEAAVPEEVPAPEPVPAAEPELAAKPARRPKPASAARAKAKAAPKRKARKPRSRPVVLHVHEAPAWYQALKKRIEVDDGVGGTAVMVKRALALDPKAKDHVKSQAKDERKATGWGYELLSGGKHVAWIIASDEEMLVLTDIVGNPDYKPSKHKLVGGLASRLTASILPKFIEQNS